jgi:hypothetical protein
MKRKIVFDLSEMKIKSCGWGVLLAKWFGSRSVRRDDGWVTSGYLWRGKLYITSMREVP